jgi:hypothetical protein
VQRYAELQPVFAGAFHLVVATFASGAELAMTVVTMPATFGVRRRPKVADWDFLCLLFAHVTFLQ